MYVSLKTTNVIYQESGNLPTLDPVHLGGARGSLKIEHHEVREANAVKGG